MTNTDIFNGLNTKINVIANTLRSHANITNSYNLSFGCYEAGQGLVGSNSITDGLQIGVQTDDRMRVLYTKYF
jgi:hypothetical protein